MLILIRGKGQSIFIGRDIKITIIESNNGQVRVGIDAPKEISILRQEVAQRYGLVDDFGKWIATNDEQEVKPTSLSINS